MANYGASFLLIGLFLYFLPWVLACLRGLKTAFPIFILNLFLGWTLLGWVVALTMACWPQEKNVQTLAAETGEWSAITPAGLPEWTRDWIGRIVIGALIIAIICLFTYLVTQAGQFSFV
jgi:hypothetical protein